MALVLRSLRSLRAAIVLIAALSSVLAALPQATCTEAGDHHAPPAVAAQDTDAHDHHGGHHPVDAADAEAPGDTGCSHGHEGVNCQQHCTAQAVVASVAPPQPAAALVVSVDQPAQRPATVTITADPPPPRA